MKNDEIDEILKNAVPAPQRPRPEALQRVADAIRPSLRRVRPLAPGWVTTGGLFLVCASVSLTGALRTGFFGFQKMDLAERGVIFSALAALLWAAANEFTSAMVPGSRRRVASSTLLLICCGGLAGAYVLLFHDHSTDGFVPVGLGCLWAGLQHAVPAALLSWLIVRRGFPMNAAAAGLVAGTLGGLAGVGMLELHCPNFETAHLVVWHTAVVPVTAVLGALVGWAARAGTRLRSRRTAPQADV